MRSLGKANRLLLTWLLLFAVTVSARDGSIDAARDAILGESQGKSLLVIGEMHGTREAPAVVAALAEHFAQAGPVWVGLEVPTQEQAPIDAFLVSDGGIVSRRELLTGEFWQKPREQSDGRRSRAMFSLLERIRELRAGGCAIHAIAFDDVGFFDLDMDRDALMAARLRELRMNHPDATLLVLTGNYHARLVLPSRATSNGQVIVPPTPMAARLLDLGALSINLSARGGTYWACGDGVCGTKQSPVGATTARADAGVRSRRLEGQWAAYHVEVTLPRYTASAPTPVD